MGRFKHIVVQDITHYVLVYTLVIFGHFLWRRNEVVSKLGHVDCMLLFFVVFMVELLLNTEGNGRKKERTRATQDICDDHCVTFT